MGARRRPPPPPPPPPRRRCEARGAPAAPSTASALDGARGRCGDGGGRPRGRIRDRGCGGAAGGTGGSPALGLVSLGPDSWPTGASGVVAWCGNRGVPLLLCCPAAATQARGRWTGRSTACKGARARRHWMGWPLAFSGASGGAWPRVAPPHLRQMIMVPEPPHASCRECQYARDGAVWTRTTAPRQRVGDPTCSVPATRRSKCAFRRHAGVFSHYTFARHRLWNCYDCVVDLHEG